MVYNVAHALSELFATLAGVRPGPADDSRARKRQPLVLLSGMLGDASVWDEVAAELVDVAIVRPARIDLDDSVPEMAASVLAEAPAEFALAGHSLGAIVALEIVRQAPDRVTRLALVNASARGPSEAQRSTWAQWSERTCAGQFAEVAAELARLTLPASRRNEAELVARNERMADTVGPDGFRRQLAAQATRPDSLAALELLTGPVLVIAGGQDEVCPPARQSEIVARCRGAELVRIADAGHMSPLERPAEVARHLRRWLHAQ